MIPQAIIQMYKLSPYFDGWLRGRITLPSGKSFTHYFFESEEEIYFQVTVSKLSTIEELHTFLSKVKENINIGKRRLLKCNIKIGRFDSMLFVPSECTRLPKTGDAFFDQNRYMVFPIYDCEFSGEETCSEMKSIYASSQLDISDWTRTACPIVYCWFENPQHQYRTIGKKLCIENEATIYNLLNGFNSNNARMKLCNRWRELINISYNEDTDKFIIAPLGITKSYVEIVTFIQGYLRKPLSTLSRTIRSTTSFH